MCAAGLEPHSACGVTEVPPPGCMKERGGIIMAHSAGRGAEEEGVFLCFVHGRS